MSEERQKPKHHNYGKPDDYPVPYQRDVILENSGWSEPYIAVLHACDCLPCTLCGTFEAKVVLELDTADCEYEVLFLCADCVKGLLVKMESKQETTRAPKTCALDKATYDEIAEALGQDAFLLPLWEE